MFKSSGTVNIMGFIKKLLLLCLISMLLSGDDWAEHCPKFIDSPLVEKAKLADGENAVKVAIADAEAAGKSAAGVGLAAQNEAVQNLSFAQSLGRNLRAAAIHTATSTAANGGKVARNALSAVTEAIVDVGAASVAQEIGRAYRNGSGDMSWLTHKVCHFVLGGGSAALRGEDPLAGAIGATIGEVVADAMIQRALERTRADVLEQLEDFRDTYGTLPPVQDAEASLTTMKFPLSLLKHSSILKSFMPLSIMLKLALIRLNWGRYELFIQFDFLAALDNDEHLHRNKYTMCSLY